THTHTHTHIYIYIYIYIYTFTFMSVLLGMGQLSAGRMLMAHILSLGLVAALVISAVMLPSIEWWLVTVLGCSDAVLPTALAYSRVIFVFAPFGYFMVTGLLPLLRCENRAPVAMMMQILASLVNVIGDPIFMGLFDLGIAGAAYSTSFSQWAIGACVLFFYLRPKSTSDISPNFKGMFTGGFDISLIQRVLSGGIGQYASMLPPTLCTIVANIQLAAYAPTSSEGDTYVAAMGLALRFQSLLFMPMIGLCLGLQPVLGYNYGKKNFTRMRRATVRVLYAAFIFTIVCTTFMEIFPSQLAGAFSDDDEVVRVATTMTRVTFAACWLQAATQVANVITQVYHNVGINILVTLGRPVFMITLEFLLPLVRGINGVWEAFFIADSLTG
ncbi:multi antimicrobial extrusion protein, partial [Kipferlia bialata]